MKKVLIFSQPTEKNTEVMLKELFDSRLKSKRLAYMPADGSDCPEKYLILWQKYANKNNAELVYIDNSLNDPREQTKLLSCNILLITGGNTFQLLRNLRQSGLFETIKKFVKKDEFIIGGFSAGALVLTPTISICNSPNYDENLVGITDLTGLNILDFELFPHYRPELDSILSNYERNTGKKLLRLTNDDYKVINL